MSTILALDHLTRRFGDVLAADNVTLSVDAGEVFGLLGPNGAGKSTTIKMLTTLLPPTSGTATIAGYSITTQQSQVRRVIGYVPQALSADGTLTGYENLLTLAASVRTSTAPNTVNRTRSATGVLPRMAHSARERGRSTSTTASKLRSNLRTSSRPARFNSKYTTLGVSTT
jgi:ABC-2 type transport system ATP-binding protein